VTLQIEAQARRLLTQIGRSGLVLPESETLNGYSEAKFVTKVTDNTCGAKKYRKPVSCPIFRSRHRDQLSCLLTVQYFAQGYLLANS